MITDKQREWLQGLRDGTITKKDDPHKYSVYRKRIRERMERQFENLLFVANEFPEIITDEEYEIQTYGSIVHKNFKILYRVMKAINPDADIQLIAIRKELKL